MAHVRFWAFSGILLLACAVVAVTVWGEVAADLRHLSSYILSLWKPRPVRFRRSGDGGGGPRAAADDRVRR